MALACLYCSFEDKLKNALVQHHCLGEAHCKTLQGQHADFPDEPEIAEKVQPQSDNSTSLSTCKQLLPHEDEIIKQLQTAKCFFKEEQATLVSLVPKNEGLKLSALEKQAPLKPIKCHAKQGPIKSSKKVKIPRLLWLSSIHFIMVHRYLLSLSGHLVVIQSNNNNTIET